MTAEELAKLFHTKYEELAPHYSYTTRKASAVPWDEVPANNRLLMINVAAEVLVILKDRAEAKEEQI